MKVKRVNSHTCYEKVWEFTYESYLNRGYCVPNKEKRLRLFPNLDEIEQTTTLVVENYGEIIGTISITEDGPNLLSTDISFGHKTSLIRHRCTNKKLGCVWRLISSNCEVTRLIEEGLEEIGNRDIDIVLSIINPKHFGFYNRCLGFTDMERLEKDIVVNYNPSLLIYSNYEDMVSKWKEKNERQRA